MKKRMSCSAVSPREFWRGFGGAAPRLIESKYDASASVSTQSMSALRRLSLSSSGPNALAPPPERMSSRWSSYHARSCSSLRTWYADWILAKRIVDASMSFGFLSGWLMSALLRYLKVEHAGSAPA